MGAYNPYVPQMSHANRQLCATSLGEKNHSSVAVFPPAFRFSQERQEFSNNRFSTERDPQPLVLKRRPKPLNSIHTLRKRIPIAAQLIPRRKERSWHCVILTRRCCSTHSPRKLTTIAGRPGWRGKSADNCSEIPSYDTDAMQLRVGLVVESVCPKAVIFAIVRTIWNHCCPCAVFLTGEILFCE